MSAIALRAIVAGTLLVAAAAPLAAQTDGAIAGRVREAGSGRPLPGARVEVVGLGRTVEADSAGAYRVPEVRAGVHVVEVRAIGYRMARFRGVRVLAGEVATVDADLHPATVLLDSVIVATTPDPVLDPLSTATAQHITAEEIRRLPVTTVAEAVAISAGAVGESYRGGRLGEQSFILDGLGVKNRLDASTGTLGVRVPPDLLTEAALITNGFSARYGQAISGLVNVVTRDGGDRWHGRAAFESDRALPRALDVGFDRVVAAADGPLPGGLRFVGVVDATGRIDADPVNAPAPPEPLGRRAGNPRMLPHNSGEQIDLAAKLTVPLGAQATFRLFGLRSVEQRLLFDPAYAYDDAFAPARRTRGDLVTGHIRMRLAGTAERGVALDVRGGYFARDFVRGQLDGAPAERFGAFTFSRFRIVGEGLARAQDTAAARLLVPGLRTPDYSANSPWGVPAFFLGGGSNGEVSWTGFREWRGQVDATIAAGRQAEFAVGGEVVSQRVQTFRRVLGYEPVGGAVPPAAAADFSPLSAAAYAETAVRLADLALTAGLRYDQFDARADLGARRTRSRRSLSPRFGVSTVLPGATVVVSWGKFSQAPDFQYLVDAAFDDSMRTGRFRRGNPDLGFESSWQYEMSVRMRPTSTTSLRVNAFYRRLEGLVASVPFGLDPDSTVFGNTDFGTVKGVEVLAERDFGGGWGVRVTYTLQQALATASDPFQLLRRIKVAPGQSTDTIYPGALEIPLDYDRRHGLTGVVHGEIAEGGGPRLFGARPLAGAQAAAIVRWSSGLPYSRVDSTGDSLVGLPNSHRLPSQFGIDILVRRPLRLAGLLGSVYVDVRNLLDARTIVAVRKDNGQPGLGASGIQAMADAAYRAHPEPIPYESPRYRRWADLDGNGMLEGQAELLPLFLAAARDFAQPLFAYGPPRLVRLGIEFVF